MARFTSNFILTSVMVTGYVTAMIERNLEMVAKDWCKVIRDSHVIGD